MEITIKLNSVEDMSTLKAMLFGTELEKVLVAEPNKEAIATVQEEAPKEDTEVSGNVWTTMDVKEIVAKPRSRTKAKPKELEVEVAPDQVVAVVKAPVSEVLISLEDCRALAAQVSRAGKREELANLFKSYGAAKLSGIDQKEYPKLISDLKALI